MSLSFGAGNIPGSSGSAGETLFRWAVYVAQTFFGAWYLIHGLNFWLHFFPQPTGPQDMVSELIGVLIRSGLFELVKVTEVIAAIMLLTHRFVPLAIILAIPSALVIVYINFVLQSDLQSTITGVTALVILALLCIGHFNAFRNLFRYRAGPPSTAAFVAAVKNPGAVLRGEAPDA
jgi:uncharacterized membrane protein YphA (DoxX/SURF4 family)